MEAHPDQGFTRLALRLHMAWACAQLSGVERAVLDALAMDCWALGRKGYVSDLRPAQIAALIDRSKRQVNDALITLEAWPFARRRKDGRIEIVPTVPDRLRAHVQGWYERTVGGKPPTLGGNPPTPPDLVGGNPPEVGGKPPTGTYKVRARGQKDLTLTSSSIPTGSIKADDDENSEAGKHYAPLMAELARLVSRQTRANLEETLQLLLKARGTPGELSQAAASLIVAIRDQGLRIKSNPVGLLIDAKKRPADYPKADPAKIAATIAAHTPRERPKSEELRSFRPGK